ncbi:MAG: tetratricopeptide repeat protein [Okeania sp. SIO3B3]|nr:tetratricopeptide repeat protein [Okeania sp. SIO3B3]
MGLAELYREQGRLDAAEQYMQKSLALGEQTALPDWPYRLCRAQARTKIGQGDFDAALTLLDKAAQLYYRTPLPQIQSVHALKARVWIKQGRVAEAMQWARDHNLSSDDDLHYLREHEHITLARVLLADGAIADALGLLARLLDAAYEGGRMGHVIEILIAQALAHHTQNDISQALTSLELALTLAQPEGYVRVFVDEGSPMEHLLEAAAKQAILPDYTRKLRSFFDGRADDKISQPLIEPLSDRELEILRLIAQGLSNREISERLFLALDTVKGHNRRIFGKLDVQRRTEAVARARKLGVL